MSENSRVRAVADKLVIAVGEPSWLLLCFATVTMTLMAIVAQASTGIQTFFDSSLGRLVTGLLVYSLACVLVVMPLWLLKGKTDIAATLGVHKSPRLKEMGMAVAAWLLYMAALVVVGYIVTLLPWVDSTQVQQLGFRDIDTPAEYLIAFLALVVLPPIAEELLFRGYLFGRLRTRMRFFASALVTSLVFGVIHGQWNVAIDTFVLSWFLCYLRETTGTIWPSMLLHALKNGVAYALLFLAPLMGWNLLQ